MDVRKQVFLNLVSGMCILFLGVVSPCMGSFDPNDYSFLVYDIQYVYGYRDIQNAMEELDINNYTVRHSGIPITQQDLETHDILIVSEGMGDTSGTSGLNPNYLHEYIRGRVLITGHDCGYHIKFEDPGSNEEQSAKIFLSQAIEYVLNGDDKGMVALALSYYEWMPEEWNIETELLKLNTITSFTNEGIESGVYDNLTTEDLSDWGGAYHNNHTNWGGGFRIFELGEDNESEIGYDVVTIAAMKSPITFDLHKADDVDELTECVSPVSGDPNVVYTIGIASRDQDHTNVYIVDHLPGEVDFVSASSNGAYNFLEHTCTWYLPSLSGYDPNDGITDPNTYFHLTVRVNPSAEPSSEIVNEVYVESDQWDGYAKEYTPICCWGPDVIYVDKNAPGYTQIGVDWSSAYTDLQDAIARAERGCRSVIWVADGEYPPGDEAADTFAIPDGVSVYGGFAGYGAASPDKRDPNVFATVLSGYIGEGEFGSDLRNNTVVTMGDQTLLDGCVVEEGGEKGIDVSNSGSTIKNCIIRENAQKGIRTYPKTYVKPRFQY